MMVAPSIRSQGERWIVARHQQKQARDPHGRCITSGHHVPSRDTATIRKAETKSYPADQQSSRTKLIRSTVQREGHDRKRDTANKARVSSRQAGGPTTTTSLKTEVRVKQCFHSMGPRSKCGNENPETTHPVVADKVNEPRQAMCKAHSVGQESVFDRLYRTATAASIGHRISDSDRAALLKTKLERHRKRAHADVVDTKKTKICGPKDSSPQSPLRRNSVDDSDAMSPTSARNLPSVVDIKARSTPERTPETAYLSSASQESFEQFLVTPSSSFSVKPHDDVDLGDHVTSPADTSFDSTPLYAPTSAPAEAWSPERESSWRSLLLPLSPVKYKGLWRMTWTDANEEGCSENKRVYPLYLRSMSNTLYEFGIGSVDEHTVAIEIVTALFYRDFDQRKVWSVENAVVVANGNHEYEVHKVARGWATRENRPQLAMVRGCVRFSLDQREVRVQEYCYIVESE